MQRWKEWVKTLLEGIEFFWRKIERRGGKSSGNRMDANNFCWMSRRWSVIGEFPRGAGMHLQLISLCGTSCECIRFKTRSRSNLRSPISWVLAAMRATSSLLSPSNLIFSVQITLSVECKLNVNLPVLTWERKACKILPQTRIQKQHRKLKLTSKGLQGTAANNSYAFMEGHLANHKAVAGDIKYCSNYCYKDTISHTHRHTKNHMQTSQSHTWIRRKEMTPLVGACERTSDVALTFRWLLALRLRLLRLLLFQLPAPLSLQHWVLILGLPVDMTVEGASSGWRVRDKKWRIEK